MQLGVFSTDENKSGFRLQYMEIFNWGTFDEHVWKIRPVGETSLLTGANGYEDYTYSNYFAGRNKFDGAASQQIMERDGFFKVRTDLLSSKTGKTDNWLSAVNFTSDIPSKINPLSLLPVKIPLKVFVDIGTYADAWKANAATTRFLYDAGLQLSLLKETVNIYFPILYSSVYSDYFKSTLGKNHFWKTVSFSIDIQRFSLKKISKTLDL